MGAKQAFGVVFGGIGAIGGGLGGLGIASGGFAVAGGSAGFCLGTGLTAKSRKKH